MKKLCLIFGICWVASSGCFGKDAYRFLSEIPIDGEGGWDILTINSTASRLYLSHVTKVVVVDLNTNTVTGEIADTPGVHALVAVPEVQRGFSSNGKESKSSVVDLTTLKTTSKIDTGSNPDAVVYEPRHGEVYVGLPVASERSGSPTAKFSNVNLLFMMRCMPSANAKPTTEALYTPLAHFRFLSYIFTEG